MLAEPSTVDIHGYYNALAADPCSYCGKPTNAIDHIVSSSQGGENDWTNFTAACGPCNSRKRDKPLLSFMACRPLLEERQRIQAVINEWAPTLPAPALTDPILLPNAARQATRRLRSA